MVPVAFFPDYLWCCVCFIPDSDSYGPTRLAQGSMYRQELCCGETVAQTVL